MVLFFYYVHMDLDKDSQIEDQASLNGFIEEIIDDFQLVSKTLKYKNRPILTHRGVFPIKEIKLDYLINALQLGLDAVFRNNHYKGERHPNEIHK